MDVDTPTPPPPGRRRTRTRALPVVMAEKVGALRAFASERTVPAD